MWLCLKAVWSIDSKNVSGRWGLPPRPVFRFTSAGRDAADRGEYREAA
jgi:hypothetical protein